MADVDQNILIAKSGKIFPYDRLDFLLAGFENRYGFILRRAMGGPIDGNTKDAEKGNYDVIPLGMGLKKSEIDKYGIVPINDYRKLIEQLSDDEIKNILFNKDLEQFIDKYNAKEKKYESVTREEVEIFSKSFRELEERMPTHYVDSLAINPKRIGKEDFEK